MWWMDLETFTHALHSTSAIKYGVGCIKGGSLISGCFRGLFIAGGSGHNSVVMITGIEFDVQGKLAMFLISSGGSGLTIVLMMREG